MSATAASTTSAWARATGLKVDKDDASASAQAARAKGIRAGIDNSSDEIRF